MSAQKEGSDFGPDVEDVRYSLTAWIQGIPVVVGPCEDREQLAQLKSALEDATVTVNGHDRPLLDGEEVHWHGQEAEERDKEQPVEEILDATCGGRSIWHPENKERDDTLYIDRREEEPGFLGQDSRIYSVDPDEIQDFRDLPYPDGSFNLVVFDPPHKKLPGGMESLTGVMNRAYGVLNAETWQSDLRRGFGELWRVLRPGGTLVFKFADSVIDFRDVLDLAPTEPLFGTVTTQRKTSETRWFVFYKPSNAGGQDDA